MLSFWEFASQHTLVLTQQCPLRCYPCALWKPNPPAPPALSYVSVERLMAALQDHSFFDLFPRVRTYHLVGGDPLESSVLDLLITYLAAHRVRVVLWTTGVRLSALASLPLLYRVVLLLPAVDRDLYREYTGWDGFESVIDSVQTLKHAKKKILIATTAHPETVPFLPDIREWCWRYQLPWLLVFYAQDAHSRESREHITHYRHVAQVWVMAAKSVSPGSCVHVPYALLQSPWCWASVMLNKYRRYFPFLR
jgi:pyruvate-formate lyase-activating enzyme